MRQYIGLVVGVILAHSVNAQSIDSVVDTTMESASSALDYKISKGNIYRQRIKSNNWEGLTTPTVNWNIGASCSGWDAGFAASDFINDAKGQMQRLQKDAVNALKGFVTQLPMLAIQRMNPGLYDMINNNMAQAEGIFKMKIKSCEEMSAKFSDVENGGLGALMDQSTWVEFSKKEEGKDQSGGSDEDKSIGRAVDEAQENKANAPIATAGNKENCNTPDMCSPTEDAANSGLEKIVGEDDESGTLERKKLAQHNDGGGSQSQAPIISWVWRIFPEANSKADVAKWIVDVVGDVKYATCEGCPKIVVVPGVGVYTEIAYLANDVRDQITELVAGEGKPKWSELNKISSEDTFLGEEVIFALRAEKANRGVFVNRLAEDIARLRTIDKLLAARRILLVGKQDSHFAQNAKNMQILDEKIALIGEEIRMIKEELELKKVAHGDTLVTLLSRYETRRKVRYTNPANPYESMDKVRENTR